MDSGKKYAPKLVRNVTIISIILIALGSFVLFMDVVTGENDAAFFGAICIALGLLLVVDLYFACLFFTMAVDKGYTDAKYLKVAFVFPYIGYKLIIAMPDLKLHNLTLAGDVVEDGLNSAIAEQAATHVSVATPPVTAKKAGDWYCNMCGHVNPGRVEWCEKCQETRRPH